MFIAMQIVRLGQGVDATGDSRPKRWPALRVGGAHRYAELLLRPSKYPRGARSRSATSATRDASQP